MRAEKISYNPNALRPNKCTIVLGNAYRGSIKVHVRGHRDGRDLEEDFTVAGNSLKKITKFDKDHVQISCPDRSFFIEVFRNKENIFVTWFKEH